MFIRDPLATFVIEGYENLGLDLAMMLDFLFVTLISNTAEKLLIVFYRV